MLEVLAFWKWSQLPIGQCEIVKLTDIQETWMLGCSKKVEAGEGEENKILVYGL